MIKAIVASIRAINCLKECPQEVPPFFDQAMKRTLQRIVERERMEREWAEIWKARREKDRA